MLLLVYSGLTARLRRTRLAALELGGELRSGPALGGQPVKADGRMNLSVPDAVLPWEVQIAGRLRR